MDDINVKLKSEKIFHGDFSKLAENYAKYRPGYSEDVLEKILALVSNNIGYPKSFADIGAGTGIWTKMVADKDFFQVINAIEPNDYMIKHGKIYNPNSIINWKRGYAEKTGLQKNSYDLVTMASSLHWADFDKAIKEFHRILRPGGIFVALWNPREILTNSFEDKIEKKIKNLSRNLNRVSSGKSKFVEDIAKKLNNLDGFRFLTFLDGKHNKIMNKSEYIGVWKSVNDVQFQLGEKFNEFLDYIKNILESEQIVNSQYITKAWVTRKSN